MLIYLTGFMGAGKTTVGRLLARETGLPFCDLDTEIEGDAGRSIPDIFRELGEVSFRDLESAALERCALRGEGVVATGGGIVEREENVERMLASGKVVYLDAEFALLEQRAAADGSKRPLFSDVAEARRRYDDRQTLYSRCHLHIPITGGQSVETVSRIVLASLEEACAT
jgi:shikimate kinase